MEVSVFNDWNEKSALFSIHIQLLIDRKSGRLKIHIPISKSLHRLNDEFGLEPQRFGLCQHSFR